MNVLEKELKEKKRKCWHYNCNKTAHFELHGWKWCFKHWRMDYQYGSCIGFCCAIKWSKLVNILIS